MPNFNDFDVVSSPTFEVLRSFFSNTQNIEVPGGVVVDTSPPVIGSFSPLPGTSISKKQPLSFSTTDLSGLQRVMIFAQFQNLKTYEVVHDGDGFSQRYAPIDGNTRTPVSAGYIFTIIRSGGWISSPKIVIVAYDFSGNTAPVSAVNYAWTLK